LEAIYKNQATLRKNLSGLLEKSPPRPPIRPLPPQVGFDFKKQDGFCCVSFSENRKLACYTRLACGNSSYAGKLLVCERLAGPFSPDGAPFEELSMSKIYGSREVVALALLCLALLCLALAPWSLAAQEAPTRTPAPAGPQLDPNGSVKEGLDDPDAGHQLDPNGLDSGPQLDSLGGT
jgi:hypothetical protein